MSIRKLVRDERGIALPAVVILAFIMLTLVAASASLAVNSLGTSRRDQDWNAALAAAEAGLDDYLYRLNRDSEYWQYNASNPAPDGNTAFTAWTDVPGSSDGEFRYAVNTSRMSSEGIIQLIASGRVRGAVRTVETLLRRRNFLDYLYFTEYETRDPAAYTGYPFSPEEAQSNCAYHYYDSPGRHEWCSDIHFISQDTINGPLHSNDALLLSGSPKFNGETSTSWDGTCPSGTECVADADRYRGSGTPVVAFPGDPRYAPPLTMPPSNSAIKAKADPAAGGIGCLFTGPTRITLNSNGTMDVNSPLTKSGNCLTGTGRPLPSNGVIFVQSVPSVPSDPNYTGSCPVSSGNPLGYPVSGDLNTSQYGCFDGDVFLSGTLKGQLTIAAQDSIVVTGNTTYQGGTTGTDLLGLVADNYVEIYHPVRCNDWGYYGCSDSTNLSGSLTDPIVHAAILTVKHSFRVQTYQYGATLGTLTVFGSIGQLYRGAVGTFSGSSPSTGYSKAYTYDQKLRYTSPPQFLDPVASSWQIKTWAECSPKDVPAPC